MAMLELAPASSGPCDTSPLDERVAVLALNAVPEAIALGRRWLTRTARSRGVAGKTADVVELLTSELLTNAVRYGHRHGAVTLRLEQRMGRLRVTVHDDGAERPVVRYAGPGSETGRGLQLVERLASAWGVTPDPAGGKSVWFEASLPNGTVPSLR